MSDATGLTKDAGWELGVRTTVPADVDTVWEFLLGEGLPLWLGEIDALPEEKGAAYATADGVRGTIRSRTEGLRVRLTWRPDDWPHDSTLQLTVKPAASGTTIGVHHEHLADRGERRMMLGHWKNVAAALDAHFSAAPTG
ncbi:MAG: SRPBCC domain-containing protein [Rhodoglobus sp.]